MQLKILTYIFVMAGVVSGISAKDCNKEKNARLKKACEQSAKIDAACKGKVDSELKACIASETRKNNSGY